MTSPVWWWRCWEPRARLRAKQTSHKKIEGHQQFLWCQKGVNKHSVVDFLPSAALFLMFTVHRRWRKRDVLFPPTAVKLQAVHRWIRISQVQTNNHSFFFIICGIQSHCLDLHTFFYIIKTKFQHNQEFNRVKLVSLFKTDKSFSFFSASATWLDREVKGTQTENSLYCNRSTTTNSFITLHFHQEHQMSSPCCENCNLTSISKKKWYSTKPWTSMRHTDEMLIPTPDSLQ